jgi:conjugal transfer pilus assembly protein TraW
MRDNKNNILGFVEKERKLFFFLSVFFVFFILFILLISLQPVTVRAANLGVYGQVYPIQEQDFLVFIHDRLKQMEKSGQLTTFKNQFIARVKAHVYRPTPVSGLTTTNHPKTFYDDPTFTVGQDIKDMNGNIIARKGTVVRPLSTITLHSVWLFFNADDSRQVEWALSMVKTHPDRIVKFILVRGDISKAEKALNGRIYFDQEGLISKKLGLKHIPCVVEQQGDRLMIREFKIIF